MESYHVYFTPRKGVSKEALVAQAHEFMATQVAHNRARSYRILEMKDKATFQGIPDYHLIVDYDSAVDLQEAFNEMKRRYKEAPHAPLMGIVSEFRVAFSTDADRPSEQTQT
jgi:hypothetical protein